MDRYLDNVFLLDRNPVKQLWQRNIQSFEFFFQFFLKIFQELVVGGQLRLHKLDDVAYIRIDRHRHVVGQVVGNIFGCKQQLQCIYKIFFFCILNKFVHIDNKFYLPI